MLVADGYVTDISTTIVDTDELQGEDGDDENGSPARVTTLDPLRSAPSLLEDLIQAIHTYPDFYAGFAGAERADVGEGDEESIDALAVWGSGVRVPSAPPL